MMLMNISGDISYILHSLVDQFDKILGTLLLLMLVLYSYSYLLLTGFSDKFADGNPATCQNFYSCFLNTIILGFIPGGGIADKLDHYPSMNIGGSFWANFFLVVSFFLLVKLILINIIGSVIINTFNTLRGEYCARIYEEENICFVCNGVKWNIQKASIDFKQHIGESHSVKGYLFFVMYLKTISNDERNEMGDYVLECFEANNFGWIPSQVYLREGKSFKILKKLVNEEKEVEKIKKIETIKSSGMSMWKPTGNSKGSSLKEIERVQKEAEETCEGDEEEEEDEEQDSFVESDEEEYEDIQH